MDGRKVKLIDSLQFRLTMGTALAILMVAIIAGGLSYWWAREEAIELQDEQLIRLAALVNHQRIAPQDPSIPVEISKADPESHFVVQWLGSAQAQSADELPNIPSDIAEGLQTRNVQGVSWRILVKTLKNGNRVLVAQQTEVRDEIAIMSTLDTLIPLIVLMLLLTLIVSYLIRQVFAPLKKLAAQLDGRPEHDLTPLPEENLALEISPFVVAINRLLNRVNHSMVQQRQFVRDAAHELRSPLTSISLQAERLIELSVEPALRNKLVNLHKATERTRILIEQLLSMARAQENIASSDSDISLKAVLRETLEDLLPQAEAKQIAIAVLGADLKVKGDAMDLHIILKNIIDNAIRYTPHNGTVDILLENKNTFICVIVKDSGPGIASDEQARVFDPFYRVPGTEQVGSGLGLFIVKNIVDRLGLELEIYNNTDKATGLSVAIRFPHTNPAHLSAAELSTAKSPSTKP